MALPNYSDFPSTTGVSPSSVFHTQSSGSLISKSSAQSPPASADPHRQGQEEPSPHTRVDAPVGVFSSQGLNFTRDALGWENSQRQVRRSGNCFQISPKNLTGIIHFFLYQNLLNHLQSWSRLLLASNAVCHFPACLSQRHMSCLQLGTMHLPDFTFKNKSANEWIKRRCYYTVSIAFFVMCVYRPYSN